MVNERFAKINFHGENPLGRHLLLWGVNGAIARDMDERDSPAFRVFRKRVGEIPGTKSVEAIGHGGERERAALDEFGGNVLEISHDTTSIRKLLRCAGPATGTQARFMDGLDRAGYGRHGFSVKPEYRKSLVFRLRL